MLRDHSFSRSVSISSSPKLVESLDLHDATVFALELGFPQVFFESDCFLVIQGVKGRGYNVSLVFHILDDIKWLMYNHPPLSVIHVH